ncbi:serine/threonine-protein phosphatase 2A regulatory subunit B'' subunit gamma [Corchorus capsularis]|uniref:Serine/threonine-protein phosphatase 2A regulatory subunit B'' subunit gamma n=1 Tax=Corchorus capsularis TaxID=210143 RepID=A0A1R3IW73_COCAP|nr:serine/threonine-protein phosphatase 2A regulatory subunit B'' subunit gamma [Corchorus capsularis]
MSHYRDDMIMPGDIFLLQLCSGVDENAVGTCAELIFAPIDASFSDDAPIIPSGFRIIPLDSGMRVALALSPSRFGSNTGFQTPPGTPEAQTLARWICQSYRCYLGAELLKNEGSENILKMLWHHTDAVLCCSLKEMEAYIRGLIPNLAQLRDMPAAFVQMYCRIAAHKFFFCDPNRRGKACIKKVLLSNCLQELMELHQETEEEVTDTEQAENWFSLTSAQRICELA